VLNIDNSTARREVPQPNHELLVYTRRGTKKNTSHPVIPTLDQSKSQDI